MGSCIRPEKNYLLAIQDAFLNEFSDIVLSVAYVLAPSSYFLTGFIQGILPPCINVSCVFFQTHGGRKWSCLFRVDAWGGSEISGAQADRMLSLPNREWPREPWGG